MATPPVEQLKYWADNDQEGAPAQIAQWLGLELPGARLAYEAWVAAVAGDSGLNVSNLYIRTLASLTPDEVTAGMERAKVQVGTDMEPVTRDLELLERAMLRELVRLAALCFVAQGQAMAAPSPQPPEGVSLPGGAGAGAATPQSVDSGSEEDSMTDKNRAKAVPQLALMDPGQQDSEENKLRKKKKNKDKKKDKKKRKKSKKKKTSSSSRSSSSSSGERFPVRLFIDQSHRRSHFTLIDQDELDKAQEVMLNADHAEEEDWEAEPHKYPTDVQLSGLVWSLRKKHACYADPAVFRPDAAEFGRAMEKGADALRQATLAGPQGHKEWRRFWRVYSMALIGLKLATVRILRQYLKLIGTLAGKWTRDWMLLRRADWLLRKIRFPKYLREARRKHPELLYNPDFRNGDASIQYCFQRAVKDTTWWHEEVTEKSDRISKGLLKIEDVTRPGYGEVRYEDFDEPLPARTPKRHAPTPPPASEAQESESEAEPARKKRKRNRPNKKEKRERMKETEAQNQWPASSWQTGWSGGPGGGGRGGGGRGQGPKGASKNPSGRGSYGMVPPPGDFGKGGKFFGKNKGKDDAANPKGKGKQKGQCWEFFRNGWCSKGQSCPFRHS